MATPARRLLTVNPGSSSLKIAVYELDGTEKLILSAEAERIGLVNGRMRVTDADGTTLLDERGDLADHRTALGALLAWLRSRGVDRRLDAIGHRIVHGGSRHRDPQLITPELLAELRELAPIDPDHLPAALGVIEQMADAHPAVPQVACFDTAFHRSMPRLAQLYALPRRLWDTGLVRYGFHGLSCEYIMQELRILDGPSADGRVIIAHLGNGASLTAVRHGVSVDTTMGFTPTGGLMMGTRSGDLEPGVLLFLLQSQGMSPEALGRLVNREAGLLGVSGSSHDMRDLLDRESSDPRAAEAVALFCYLARKFLGSLVAVLGGLDTLIFTAGIGEHAAPVRERISAGLEFLGIELDPRRNAANAPIISRDGSRARVRVIKTDEDLMVARHVRRLLSASGVDDV
jgi:acetate kinase